MLASCHPRLDTCDKMQVIVTACAQILTPSIPFLVHTLPSFLLSLLVYLFLPFISSIFNIILPNFFLPFFHSLFNLFFFFFPSFLSYFHYFLPLLIPSFSIQGEEAKQEPGKASASVMRNLCDVCSGTEM